MLKFNIFGLFLLLIILSCSQAPEIEIAPTGRLVLAELFTWARCVYCPYAAKALDSLAKEFQDSLVIISYHRRVLGDTLSPPYVENRKNFYYDSGGEPAVLFDGTGPVWTQDPSQNYQTYKNYIISRRNKKSPLLIKLASHLQSNTGIIKATVVPTDTITMTNLSLFFVICEDSVRFIISGATDTIFNHVMRLMIPNENGIPCTLAFGDSLIKETQFSLNQNWNRDNLKIISFVQNLTTKEILQSAIKKPTLK